MLSKRAGEMHGEHPRNLSPVCVWMCEHLLFLHAFELGVSGVFQEKSGICKPKKMLWSNAELTED